ncbi:MAG: hypothetical protein ACYCQM_01460 [Acidithiobacillus sp.]
MTPSEMVIAQGLFWYAFGGCLFALLVYEIALYIMDLLVDILPVAFLWFITKWGKRP